MSVEWDLYVDEVTATFKGTVCSIQIVNAAAENQWLYNFCSERVLYSS